VVDIPLLILVLRRSISLFARVTAARVRNLLFGRRRSLGRRCLAYIVLTIRLPLGMLDDAGQAFQRMQVVIHFLLIDVLSENIASISDLLVMCEPILLHSSEENFNVFSQLLEVRGEFISVAILLSNFGDHWSQRFLDLSFNLLLRIVVKVQATLHLARNSIRSVSLEVEIKGDNLLLFALNVLYFQLN